MVSKNKILRLGFGNNRFHDFTVAIFFFVIAISLFMIMNTTINANIKVVKNSLVEDKALYQSDFGAKELTASGASILSKIYNGLDVDLIIDGRVISKNTDGNSFDYSSLDNMATYGVKDNIDTTGKVTAITYTKQ